MTKRNGEMTKGIRSEQDYLDQYDAAAYAAPLVTVDIGIFTLHDDQLKVLLVRREEHPEKDKWALPGGFVDIAQDASLEATAMRKLQAKAGVKAPYLEQLGSIGNAHRDPRGWSLSVMYFALIPYVAPSAGNGLATSKSGETILAGEVIRSGELTQADDVLESVAWVAVDEAVKKKLAFDHHALLLRALERIRNKVLYTIMPAYLIKTPFTLSQLQRAYEVIMDREVEKKAFRRRLEHADVLQDTGGMVSEGPGRPASLYRVRAGLKEFNFARQMAQ